MRGEKNVHDCQNQAAFILIKIGYSAFFTASFENIESNPKSVENVLQK